MARAKGQSRLARAMIVRDAVVDAGRLTGRWDVVDLGGGRTARVWIVDGEGWTAHITTRFSGLPRDVDVKGYDEAVLLQLAPPKEDDVLIDVYHPEAGKVLSIGSTGKEETLIGMQPGPWEALFGLPYRDWTPAVTRRLVTRTSR